MSAVTTTRPVNLDQLATELGGILLTAAGNGDETTVTADVPQAALQAAIDAHVPVEPPPSETRQLRLDLDQLIVDAMFGDFPPQF